MNTRQDPDSIYHVTAILPAEPAAELGRQVKAICRQTGYTQGQLEIVAVDCGPASASVAPLQVENGHLVYLSVNKTLAEGRLLALGARLAGGEYLLFGATEGSVACDALQGMVDALEADVHLAAVHDFSEQVRQTILFRRSVLFRLWETDPSLASFGPRQWLTRLTADGYRTMTVKAQRAAAFGGSEADGQDDAVSRYERIARNEENRSDAERLAQLEALVRQAPQIAVAHNDLGVLYYRLGLKDKALRCYEAAVEKDPENPIFSKNLADFYFLERGRVEDSLRLYVRLLSLDPRDAEVLYALGRISQDTGRIEDACDFYRQLLEVDSGNADVRKRLADLTGSSEAGGRLELASAAYERAQSLVKAGRLEEAARELERLTRQYPDFAPAQNDLGAVYHQLGRKPETVAACYEQAVRLAPDNGVYRKNLADFYHVVQGRTADALRLYVRLLADFPHDTEVLMALGRVCEDIGQVEDARFFYDCVLQFDPTHTEAYQRLHRSGTQVSRIG